MKRGGKEPPKHWRRCAPPTPHRCRSPSDTRPNNSAGTLFQASHPATILSYRSFGSKKKGRRGGQEKRERKRHSLDLWRLVKVGNLRRRKKSW